MDSKDRLKILYAAGIAATATLVTLVILLLMPESLECAPGDDACTSRFQGLLDQCNPSTNIVTRGNSTNNITVRVVVYRDGDRCVIEEEVLEDAGSGVAPYDLTGMNTSCEIDADDFETFGPHACNGSISDYLPGGLSSGDDSGGGASAPSEPSILFCAHDDYECEQMVAGYLRNCVTTEFEDVDSLENPEGPVSYWTIYVNINNAVDECGIYVKMINAVDMPPGVPPEIVGWDMTCEINMTEFPILQIDQSWCTGQLLDYFYLIG